MKNVKFVICQLLMIVLICGCKKMIQVDSPKNQLTTDKVFVDSTSATATLMNSYVILEKNFDPNYSTYISLYTDEIAYVGSDETKNEFYTSRLTSSNGIIQNNWNYLYSVIYQCNDIITNLKSNGVVSNSLVIRLTSEAKYLRAFAYYYLVNIYGDVPLVLQTDISLTANASRSSQFLIYNQIIADLGEAKDGLSATYTGVGKVRANKWAAAALLSRVLLYQKKWSFSEREASLVIGSNLYTPLEGVANVFNANSKEAILQIWTQNGYTANSTIVLPSSSTSLPPYLISENLYNAFEAGDLRKINWIGTANIPGANGSKIYYYSNKYKNRGINTSSPEYLMALRISEQFLIRAEARAMLGNLDGAIDDVNSLRQRAGVKPLVKTISQQECLDAIIKERRIEFFMENGHRFFDLKRTNRLNLTMSNYKASWQNDIGQFWPIPQNEITYNHNLIQNNGY